MGRAAKRWSFFELPSLRRPQVPRKRVARCAGLGAGCGGKHHVDGVYIILSARTAGGRQLPRLAQAAKHCVDAVYLIRLRLPGRGLRRQAPCRRRLHNPQRPRGGRMTECVELPRLAQAAKHCVDAVDLILLRLPGRGLRRAPCKRRPHNPQRPQGVASVGHAAKRGVAKAPRLAAQTRAG